MFKLLLLHLYLFIQSKLFYCYPKSQNLRAVERIS